MRMCILNVSRVSAIDVYEASCSLMTLMFFTVHSSLSSLTLSHVLTFCTSLLIAYVSAPVSIVTRRGEAIFRDKHGGGGGGGGGHCGHLVHLLQQYSFS